MNVGQFLSGMFVSFIEMISMILEVTGSTDTTASVIEGFQCLVYMH